jgi:hypothetical protein
MDEKKSKELKDAMLDMELFKPDDVFHERVRTALFLILTHDTEIRNVLKAFINEQTRKS